MLCAGADPMGLAKIRMTLLPGQEVDEGRTIPPPHAAPFHTGDPYGQKKMTVQTDETALVFEQAPFMNITAKVGPVSLVHCAHENYTMAGTGGPGRVSH